MGKAELKVEIDADLLAQARAAGVALDTAAAAGLSQAIAARTAGMEDRARLWAAENADAIRDHEDRIAKGGVFGEDLRTW